MKIHLLLFTLLSLILFTHVGWGQTTYTWNVASGDWTASGSWTPSRGTPAVDDILIFNGSTQSAPTVTNIPGQTIGQLKVINNCSVTISSATSTAGTGTIARATTNVTGTSTLFTTELSVGDVIYTGTGANQSEIATITSATVMTTVSSGTIAAGTAFSIV